MKEGNAMSDDDRKNRPWVPRELAPPRPDWQIEAMESDPEESARTDLDDLSFGVVDDQHIGEVAQKMNILGYTDLADRMVAAVNELEAAIKAARDALGPSPYPYPYPYA